MMLGKSERWALNSQNYYCTITMPYLLMKPQNFQTTVTPVSRDWLFRTRIGLRKHWKQSALLTVILHRGNEAPSESLGLRSRGRGRRSHKDRVKSLKASVASRKHSLKLSVLIGFQCVGLFCLVKRARLCGSYSAFEAQGIPQVKGSQREQSKRRP